MIALKSVDDIRVFRNFQFYRARAEDAVICPMQVSVVIFVIWRVIYTVNVTYISLSAPLHWQNLGRMAAWRRVSSVRCMNSGVSFITDIHTHR